MNLLDRQFSELPKVELHCHAEGAVRVETILDLAHRFGFGLPADSVEGLAAFVQPRPGQTRADFFKLFELTRPCFQHPDAIARIFSELVQDQAADEVVHLEIRFNPGNIRRLHGLSLETIFQAALAGAHEGRRRTGISVILITALLGDLGPDTGLEIFAAADRARDDAIGGFDLFGNDGDYPVVDFEPLFARIRAADFGVTVHAGQDSGPRNVIDAVRLLGASRIGHGVQTADSGQAIEVVRSAGAVLEMCPTSNVLTQTVAGIGSHPLRSLLRQGVRGAICTDDPTMCNTTLSREYQRARDEVGLSWSELRACALSAAGAAFLPAAQREKLVQVVSDSWPPQLHA